MKKIVAFFVMCVLLVPAITSVSYADNSSKTCLTRGDFIQAMYEAHVEHSGMTVRQEQARTHQVPPGVTMPGGFGTYFHFDDINFLDPLFDATGWASIHNISNGTGPGEYNINVFSPGQVITIQEALTMAYRLVVNSGNRPELLKGSDIPSAPAWAQDAIQWWANIQKDGTSVVLAEPCDTDFATNLFSVIYQNYVIAF